jgi:signal transduction histidine kinase
MSGKLTYQELENQAAELQKQNEILRLNFSFQNLEKEKRSAELKIANIELDHQNLEKEKRAAELIIANIELDRQNLEKEKRSAELIIANIELEHQNLEKEKRAAELIIANIELDHQSIEKGRRADELRIANVELKHQNKEKEKRADELKIANVELVFQNEEKGKRAAELIISKIKFAQQGEEKEKLAEELIIANLAVALQSELIVAKEKAEENEIQLRELNATKDKLFSIIAHDLRSPFNSILGLSKLLIEDVKNNENEETAEFLGLISLSAKNTLVLLDNLLNWAKLQTGQIDFTPEKLVLSSIIKEILAISILNAKVKNTSLDYIQSDDIEVCTDKNMLGVVLRNLISNAIKFTKPGGNINVSATSKQNQVEISISDNGVGMNDETRKKLFNIPENMTSVGTANEKGSGLGLVLCKEFVEKLGGTIWVESELGKGTA